MDVKLTRLKNYFTLNKANSNDSFQKGQPQVGFRITYCEEKRELIVKIIGAKQLPTSLGNFKLQGYLIKVTLFPGKEKFETKCVRESWPTINEEFKFTFDSNIHDIFKHKFVSFTVYAESDLNNEETKSKTKNQFKRFLSFTEVDVRKHNVRTVNRRSISSRRMLGAVTYNLDKDVFTQKVKDNVISTPDIWRGLKDMTSGFFTQSREGQKGNVEVTLQYALSEDGSNDVIEISVTKFRCNLQTMQDHEKLGGQLYIKISAFECEDVVQKMKSDKFDATISLKIEENSATLRASVNKRNLEEMKILIRLLCRTTLGKKIELGKIEINNNSDVWKKIMETPSVPLTQNINFQ